MWIAGIKAVVYLDRPELRDVASHTHRPVTRQYDANTRFAEGEENKANATKRMFNLAKVRCASYTECYETKSVILDFAESDIS